MLASSSSRAIELMSSKAAFLPSEPEGLIFGHDRDCRCRTPIEQVIDAQHHRLHVRIVHIESIRHDAGGDNPYTTAARATAARTTATSTPPTSTTAAVMVWPVSHRKAAQPDVLILQPHGPAA